MSWHTFETVKPGDPVNDVWAPTLRWLEEHVGNEWVVEVQHRGACSTATPCRMMPCPPVLARGPLGYRSCMIPTPAVVALGDTPRESFENLVRALS